MNWTPSGVPRAVVPAGRHIAGLPLTLNGAVGIASLAVSSGSCPSPRMVSSVGEAIPALGHQQDVHVVEHATQRSREFQTPLGQRLIFHRSQPVSGVDHCAHDRPVLVGARG